MKKEVKRPQLQVRPLLRVIHPEELFPITALSCVIFVLFCFFPLFAYESAGVIRLKRSLNVDDEEELEPFVADHPCLWLLRHNPTGMWLFVGRLARPADISSTDVPLSRDEL